MAESVEFPPITRKILQVLGGAVYLHMISREYAKRSIEQFMLRNAASILAGTYMYGERIHKEKDQLLPMQYSNWISTDQEHFTRFCNQQWDYLGEGIPLGDYVILLECLSPLVGPRPLLKNTWVQIRADNPRALAFSRVKGNKRILHVYKPNAQGRFTLVKSEQHDLAVAA